MTWRGEGWGRGSDTGVELETPERTQVAAESVAVVNIFPETLIGIMYVHEVQPHSLWQANKESFAINGTKIFGHQRQIEETDGSRMID